MAKITQEEFIDRCKKSHNINYDYSKVKYIGLRNRVIIGCPIHGYIEVFAQSFMRGSICRKCEMERRTKTFDDFIKRAKEIHGDRYDYSKVKYKNLTTKIEIVCKKHGSFFVRPESHLHKTGGNCQKCSLEHLNDLKMFTTDDFIEMSKSKFGNKFNYDEVIYNGLDKNIILKCPIHGKFEIRPDAHLRSNTGCPKCSYLKNRNIIDNFGIYDYNDVKDRCIESLWRGMIHRCYNKKTQEKNPSYYNCSVCEEWKYFSNFYKWIKNPENGYIKGYHLDKDILVQGNRLYSPDTCCFVPKSINSFFTKNKKIKNKGLPQGIIISHNKFRAAITFNKKHIHLGYYDNVKDALEVYNFNKYKIIKQLAYSYYAENKITKKVYDAMLKYKINGAF